MLVELRDRLLSENRQYGVYQLWKSYKVLDEEGNVDELDIKHNINALTNLIQIVRYAYGKNQKLTSLVVGYARRFSLYCGQNQRILTDDQVEIMKQIAEYVINDGAISAIELNSVNADLWRKGVTSFTAPILDNEMQTLAKFLLRTA
jgi:type I restriction enzyme R subunit